MPLFLKLADYWAFEPILQEAHEQVPVEFLAYQKHESLLTRISKRPLP
ncbi:MAG TPA: hypothetical protein VKB78_03655 [Pirellulales bacterium]|nr:hypothetical protein [Pirellulales bacterium]